MRIKRHILPDEERYVFYLQKADGAKMFREKMGKAVVFFMQFVRFTDLHIFNLPFISGIKSTWS